ncbi:MAG: hypothetical protein QW059_05200 [Nitrososphaerota archaeon]
MRLRVKRWPEVRMLLILLLLQVSFSVFASLTASMGALTWLTPWSLRLVLLAILSTLTLAVGVEAGRTRHRDLAATTAAIAAASQLLYTLVILQ